MPLQILQNFYKQTVAVAWAVGTGNRYVSALPTPTSGRLTINPADSSKREIVSYSGVGTDGTGTYITLTARGLGGTTEQTHSVGEPIRMNITAEHYSDIQTELDLKAPINSPTFTGTPLVPQTPTASAQAASKAYVDLVAGGSANYDQEIIDGTTGEALTAGQVAYFKEADAKWYLADADLVATFNELRLGMVQTTAAGANLSTTILLSGLQKNQTGLTPGAKYYLSNTAGAITTSSAQTNVVFIGWAKSATQLILSPMNIDAPTADEKNAMAGASGTPRETNRFETENDTSNGATQTAATIAFVNSNPDTITDSGNGFVTAGFKRGQTITITGSVSNNGTFTIASVTAGTITLISTDSLTAESAGASVTIATAINEKLARYSSTGQLRVPTTAVAANDAVSKAHLDANATLKAEDYTAGEAITALDAIYPSAANTIKTIIPTTVGTRVAIATAPTSVAYSPLHINLGGGRVLRLAGGDGNSRIALKAQVRSINAAETDLTNGSEQTIFSSTDVLDFAATLIATDKVMVIYQTTNAGSANGIRAVVLSISGTTISMGAEQVIESLGSTNGRPAVAKLNTDKALICYRKDSDAKPYVQVLTVSGITITTNTPYKVDDTQFTLAEMAQITTDTALLIYHTGSNTTVNAYVLTVSGTVVTIGSANNIYTSNGGVQVDLRMINTTTAVIIYFVQNNTGAVAKLTISGNTVTKGSNLTLTGNYVNSRARAGIQLIGAKRAYVLYRTDSNTTLRYAYLDISGATPTSLATDSWSTTAVTGYGCAVGKLKPWLYYLDSEATGANDDFIQPLSTTQIHIGIAPVAIANAASGAVDYRYLTSNNLSGLTAGSRYYVDDNGQPTTESSLTSPSLGVAISTTKMLMQ